MKGIISCVYDVRNLVIASDALHKSLHSCDMINAEKFNSGTVLKHRKSTDCIKILLPFGLLLIKYE